MRTLRVVAVLAVVCGVIGVGISPAGAGDPVSAGGGGRGGSQTVTLAVPMTCVGTSVNEARTITVSATLPRQVAAGTAYTVTNLTTDVPLAGAVTITASSGNPAILAPGSGGPSQVQLVAATTPGSRTVLRVTRADYVIPGTITGPRPALIPGVRVGCTPVAPVRLASIDVVGPHSGRAPATAAIDAAFGLYTTVIDQPFSGDLGRVTTTVPTKLRVGQTFTLADLQATVPQVPLGQHFTIVAQGADPATVTAGSVHRVTARPGGTVELSVVTVTYDNAGGVVVSSPIGSGWFATIPVLPRR